MQCMNGYYKTDFWELLIFTHFRGEPSIFSEIFSTVTLSTALNLVHRNSFPKLAKFPSYFTELCNFPGGATSEKHADPGKKNRNSRKSRSNSRNLLVPFLRSRKEENLCGHCAVNNARRILSKGSTLLRGCWVWSKKLRFRENFHENFNAVERVSSLRNLPYEWTLQSWLLRISRFCVYWGERRKFVKSQLATQFTI